MRQALRRSVRVGGLLLASLVLTTAVLAQTGDGEGLSQTLANIKKTHVVRLGYRESSPPFSFLDQANRPIGYSLELCEAIADEIGVEVDDSNLKIEYVKVTSDSRIAAVVENQIDLECGSTTANAERAKQVAFSPLIFVAGTKLMVPKASTVSAPGDDRLPSRLMLRVDYFGPQNFFLGDAPALVKPHTARDVRAVETLNETAK